MAKKIKQTPWQKAFSDGFAGRKSKTVKKKTKKKTYRKRKG